MRWGEQLTVTLGTSGPHVLRCFVLSVFHKWESSMSTVGVTLRTSHFLKYSSLLLRLQSLILATCEIWIENWIYDVSDSPCQASGQERFTVRVEQPLCWQFPPSSIFISRRYGYFLHWQQRYCWYPSKYYQNFHSTRNPYTGKAMLTIFLSY